MPYMRQAEKLSAARHCLMLPHSRGIDDSIAEAFRECDLAFSRMDEGPLDDNARKWVARVKTLAEVAKGRSLSTDEQVELSQVVDELAHWFEWESRNE
jgi:hypothetical protein